jgi:TPR repeat protein
MTPRPLRLAVALLAAGLAAVSHAGPAEDTERAEQTYRSGDVVGAVALLRVAANANYAPAQVRLAAILDAAEEDTAALELYRKAAAQGDAAGEYGVGLMHAKGEGTRKDPAEALRWYRQAAAKNYVPAVEAIAWAYLTGDLGLARDPKEAEAWGERAAKLGGRKPALTPAAPTGTAASTAAKK